LPESHLGAIRGPPHATHGKPRTRRGESPQRTIQTQVQGYSSNPIGFTQGVGYQAYGAVGVPFSACDKATTLKVIVSRSNSSASKGIHVAVNKDTPLMRS
jgi:hypothetical protein